jgi:periplasmic protein TonB
MTFPRQHKTSSNIEARSERLAETGMAIASVVSALLHVGLLCLPINLSPTFVQEDLTVFILEESGIDRRALDPPQVVPKPAPPKSKPKAARILSASAPPPAPPESVAPLGPTAPPIPSENQSLPAPPPVTEAHPRPNHLPPAEMATLAPAGRDAVGDVSPADGSATTTPAGIVADARGAAASGLPDTSPSARGGAAVPATSHGASAADAEVGAPTGPRFVVRATPLYPPLARRLGQEATVVLRLTIDERGRLAHVEAVQPADYGFTDSAVDAAQRSVFAPAEREGRPVACQALLPVRFVLRRSE